MDTQDVASLLAGLSETQPPSAGSAAAANPLRLLLAGGAEPPSARRSIRKRAAPARLRVSTAAGIVPPGAPAGVSGQRSSSGALDEDEIRQLARQAGPAAAGGGNQVRKRLNLANKPKRRPRIGRNWPELTLE